MVHFPDPEHAEHVQIEDLGLDCVYGMEKGLHFSCPKPINAACSSPIRILPDTLGLPKRGSGS